MDELKVGDRLPKLRLPRAGDPATVRPLRGPARDASVVAVLHDPTCEACRELARSLVDIAPDLDVWDAAARVVVPAAGGTRAGPPARALRERLEPAVDVLVDVDRQLVDRVDTSDGPALLIADRWGQLFHIHEAGRTHGAMEPRELVEWLKYLATQCPE